MSMDVSPTDHCGAVFFRLNEAIICNQGVISIYIYIKLHILYIYSNIIYIYILYTYMSY